MNLLRPQLAKVLGISATAMLLVVVVYRFAVYRHMYIAPGDPYGISDVIEFLLGIALMAVLCVSLVAALVLAIRGPRDNRIAAAWLFGSCALIVVLVEPLHTLAARYAP
jgi:lysylphosphatidylglycerol synthetase-like protein (DUF2156 family)